MEDSASVSSASIVPSVGIRLFERERRFLAAVGRLVEGAAFIAAFLVLEAALLKLGELTSGSVQNETRTLIRQGIDIFSDLGAASLFIIHFIKVAKDYIRL